MPSRQMDGAVTAETMRDPVEVRLREIENRWHGDGVATRADIAWLIEQVRSRLPQVDYRFFDKFGDPLEVCSECGGWGVLTRRDNMWTCPVCGAGIGDADGRAYTRTFFGRAEAIDAATYASAQAKERAWQTKRFHHYIKAPEVRT